MNNKYLSIISLIISTCTAIFTTWFQIYNQNNLQNDEKLESFRELFFEYSKCYTDFQFYKSEKICNTFNLEKFYSSHIWDSEPTEDIKIKKMIQKFDLKITSFYKEEVYNILIKNLNENNLINLKKELLALTKTSTIIKDNFFNNIIFLNIKYKKYHFSTTDMKKTIKFLPTIRPIEKYSRISSNFVKKRWHPILRKYTSHLGTDYAAPVGTPIYSPLPGIIRYIGYRGGYGKAIIIEHDNNITTRYYHLNQYSENLKIGKRVDNKEIIGYVGNTGRTTGSHLHYEVSIFNNKIDPEKIISLKKLVANKALDDE